MKNVHVHHNMRSCGGYKEKYRAGLASLWNLRVGQMPWRRKGTAGEPVGDTRGASQKVLSILQSVVADLLLVKVTTNIQPFKGRDPHHRLQHG